MPYINQELRTKLDGDIENLKQNLAQLKDSEIEGALNYTITSLLDVVKDVGEKRWRYIYINRIIGVLECLKLEFYVRLGRKYEDKAIETNGDLQVYKDI